MFFFSVSLLIIVNFTIKEDKEDKAILLTNCDEYVHASKKLS